MVFQSYALYPHLTVFDNIAVPLRMRRHSALARTPLLGRLLPGRARTERGIREEVERVAAQLELSSLLRRKPGQLSGGQRQRVAVGRAIVRQPLGFLFDEPLSNLDAKLRVHMRTELAQLHRQLKATFVYVTHDQAEAMTMSSRIAVMIEGHIVQVGTPAEVYENPQDIRVAEFVGSPKINAMPGVIREDGGLEVLGRPLGLSTSAPAGGCSRLRPSRTHGTRHRPGRHFRQRSASREPRLGGIRSRRGRSHDLPLLARLNPDRQLPAIGSSVHLTYRARSGSSIRRRRQTRRGLHRQFAASSGRGRRPLSDTLTAKRFAPDAVRRHITLGRPQGVGRARPALALAAPSFVLMLLMLSAHWPV